MYLAFRFSPATSACRFICSSLVIPADNVSWLPQLLRDQFWLKAQVHAQPWVWSGHKQYPAWQLLVETSEKHASLPLLCWEPGSFPVVLSVPDACSLEQSTPKSEFTQRLCQGNKAVGGGREWSGYLSRDRCYTLPTFLEESGQYRLCHIAIWDLEEKKTELIVCEASCHMLITMLRWLHSFCFVHCRER